MRKGRAVQRHDSQPSGIDWQTHAADLQANGYAVIPSVLTAPQCSELGAMFEHEDETFRSHIRMDRYNFGRGEYKYFAYPLPDLVDELRHAFYPALAHIANHWSRSLGAPANWPDTLDGLLARCHESGQVRPTPLLLSYGPGDYNCLHQDLYGDIHFPLQVVIMLSNPADYDGGELVLVEQRPRMQSRPMVLRPDIGSAVIIPVRERPVAGKRGFYRVQMRHGVSEIRSGHRRTLGLIFHDAN
jgi:hypothetical protein